MADNQPPPAVAFEPAFGDRAILMPHLNCAMVDIGSFLLVGPSNGYETDVVVRLTSATWDQWNGSHTLTVNRLEPHAPLGNDGESILSRHMTRVTTTAESWEIAVSDVIDVVHIFKEEDLEELNFVAQGRKDLFVLCQDDPSHVPEFLTFPCMSPEAHCPISYAKRVWRDLDSMRLSFRRGICREQMHQSQFATKRDKMSVSDEGWCYFKRQLSRLPNTEDVIVEEDRIVSRIDHELIPGMQRTAKRQQLSSDRITFIGNHGMSRLAHILGESSVVGVKARRPAVDTPVRPIHVNEQVTWMTKVVAKYAESTIWFLFQYECVGYQVNDEGNLIPTPSARLNAFINRDGSNQARHWLILPPEDDVQPVGPADADDDEPDNDENDDDEPFDVEEARILCRRRNRFLYQGTLHQVVRSLGDNADSEVEVVAVTDVANADRILLRLHKALVAELVRVRLL